MIAACLEVDKGVEGLWQRGDSKGWKKHANFGQFIPKNYMKAFMAGFPYVFCDEKYWTVNKNQLPWDVIMPFMNEYNDKRKNLLRVVYLVADESMGVWIPKTSKTGGLPHITYERRKPDPLGTMFRNCVEGKTGIFTAHDIVQDDNGQYRKKYHGSPSHMPKQATIQNHTAQCLRLAESSGIEKVDGLVRMLGLDLSVVVLNCTRLWESTLPLLSSIKLRSFLIRCRKKSLLLGMASGPVGRK